MTIRDILSNIPTKAASALSSSMIERIKNENRLLNEQLNMLNSRNGDTFLELKETNKVLKSVVAQRRIGGEKASKVGALLLLAPDPITGAVALPILAAAQLMKLRNGKKSDLQRMVEGTNSVFRELASQSELLSS